MRGDSTNVPEDYPQKINVDQSLTRHTLARALLSGENTATMSLPALVIPAQAHCCPGKYGINVPPCTRHSRAGGNPANNAAKRRIRNWMPACAGMTTVRLHRFLLLSWQCRHASRSVEESRQKDLLLQFFPGQ
jgi:hypothetical protein